MRDLIDRKSAIDAVNTALFPKINTAKDAEKALRRLPTAERKGHWIELKCGSASLWKCSECGELFLEDFYYCPNCSADMRGEQ